MADGESDGFSSGRVCGINQRTRGSRDNATFRSAGEEINSAQPISNPFVSDVDRRDSPDVCQTGPGSAGLLLVSRSAAWGENTQTRPQHNDEPIELYSEPSHFDLKANST